MTDQLSHIITHSGHRMLTNISNQETAKQVSVQAANLINGWWYNAIFLELWRFGTDDTCELDCIAHFIRQFLWMWVFFRGFILQYPHFLWEWEIDGASEKFIQTFRHHRYWVFQLGFRMSKRVVTKDHVWLEKYSVGENWQGSRTETVTSAW